MCARVLGRAAAMVQQQTVVSAEEIEKMEQEKGDFNCSECDFIAKSPFGLSVHMRKHASSVKEINKEEK